ncbi:hypothetical protein EW145_g2127 [Phellinidium pouzarii]|uniref:Uncharacterized protein n=1 Tax=Phellinidium pouzarii TaxID=167371 RepID=A0A4S4LC11_9AGAM|nr:hypothetical protein EW145_g2127 [Phellinidium pouzarii]
MNRKSPMKENRKPQKGRNLGEQILLGKPAQTLAQKYIPIDPRYDIDPDTNKRVERPLPPGLSEKDKKVLQKVRKRAHRLDYGINCCGFHFGRSAVIGFIPGAGPIIDMFLEFILINWKASEADLPWTMHVMMITRESTSLLVGLTPVFGDLFIAWYKANSRNSLALEKFLVERGRQALLAQESEGDKVDPSRNAGR